MQPPISPDQLNSETETKSVSHDHVLTFEEHQIEAINRINTVAEQIRQNIVTPGIGQAIVYRDKVDEATDYIVSQYPISELASYPYIHAEANATGLPANVIADGIITKRTEWIMLSTAVEYIRMKANLGVNDSTDLDTIIAIETQAILEMEKL